jgi:hypothetical protein
MKSKQDLKMKFKQDLKIYDSLQEFSKESLIRFIVSELLFKSEPLFEIKEFINEGPEWYESVEDSIPNLPIDSDHHEEMFKIYEKLAKL